MAINSAIQGAVVKAGEIDPTIQNELVNKGIISPREGGQSFEFLKPWAASQGIGTSTGGGTTGGGTQGAMDQANQLLDPNLSTPFMTPADIRSREERDKAARRIQAADIFDPKINQAIETGQNQVGSTKGQFGVSRGLGLSTAEMTYVNNLQKQIDDRVEEIRTAKDAYISTGDFEAAKRADDAIFKLQERQDKILFQKTNLALKLMEGQRADVGLDIDILSTLSKIPAGQQVTIGGQVYEGMSVDAIEPFFKGADIVSLMKALPMGEVQNITDPNTGASWELMGLASPSANTQIIQSADDRGNVKILTINKDTGQILNAVDAGKIGKSKTQPSNVSVNFPRQVQNALYDSSGKQLGFAWSNPITNTTEYKDYQGNIIPFPEGGRIGGVSSSFEQDGGFEINMDAINNALNDGE